MRLLRSKGTDASNGAPTAVVKDDVLGVLAFEGVSTTSPTRRAAVEIKAAVSTSENSVGTDSLGGELHLLVNKDGTNTMRDETTGGTKINSKGELQSTSFYVHGSPVEGADVLAFSADQLTTGSALVVQSNSDETNARSIVKNCKHKCLIYRYGCIAHNSNSWK